MYIKYAFLGTSVLTFSLLAGGSAFAAVGGDTSALRAAVTADGIKVHLQAFQDIADANGGTRQSGTPGYDASAAYVADLMSAAGYAVTLQEFVYPFFQELTIAEFEQISPNPQTYDYGTLAGFLTMSYSGSGDVTGDIEAVDLVVPAAPVDNTSTSGCEASDFDSFTAGNVALVQRGSCSFFDKAFNAEAAGASAVIIFNEGQPGRTDNFGGTLGGPGITIPVTAASYDLGTSLIPDGGPVTVRLYVNAVAENRTTVNVLADSASGRDDRIVVVGAHLDSVDEGPGVQDNGSGSAANLEVALQMVELGINPRNKVRFAWWGAEESGLLGSEYYVDQLSKRDIKDHALNLNFDMIASPNYVRFVYDGDGSDTAVEGPNGSANIERIFNEYFESQGQAYEPTEFSGRSDYGPFIEVGIPAGGLFTGAEGIKTPEQAAIYGGTAGIQYDPCYHLACDTIDNVGLQALEEMSDAVAHSVQIFATTTSAVNGTDKASDKAKSGGAGEMLFKGSNLKR